MSKQGHTYYSGPYGRVCAISPAARRAQCNSDGKYHYDPFDPDEDRWPDDKYVAGSTTYTWTGQAWIALGATDDAIDDSGGV